MEKKIKSIRFRVALNGRGVVNFDQNDQKYFLNKYCGGKDTKVENQTFAKKEFVINPNYEEEVRKYAEANNVTLEDAGKRVPQYKYRLKISAPCLRNRVFGGTSDTDAVIWDFPQAASNYIANPLGYTRGYMCPRKEESFRKKTCLNITDAVDKDAVLYDEIFTKSGDRDDTSFFLKETTGETHYTFEAFFDVAEAQFASVDDYFARRAIPSDYFEGKNYIEQAFLKNYGRIPYTVGVFSKNNAIYGQSYGEYGLKMDDQFINTLIKSVADRLLYIHIDRNGGYVDTAKVEYKPIYSSKDVTSEDGWKEVKNAEELPEFGIFQFYEESNHQEWEERKAAKEALKGVRKANKDEKKAKRGKKTATTAETEEATEETAE